MEKSTPAYAWRSTSERPATADVRWSGAVGRGLLGRYARNRAATIGLVLVGVFALLVASAPAVAPVHYLQVGVGPLLEPPSLRYVMGTDDLGRNVFAGIVYGGRVSLAVGLAAAFFATIVGLALGLVAGYRGGMPDELIMRIGEFCQTLPRFMLALVLVAILGPSVWNVVMVIAVLSWPLTARLVRAEVLSLREREFVQAARALAAPAHRLVFREIMPNALAPVVVNASLEVGRAILTEASLSFLGLGDANFPSWGYMLGYAQVLFRQAWWLSVFPGSAILLVVLGFNLIGDGLNDVLNPRRDVALA
ncbi:MAG: ABC transporter permease [Candidatus Rokubacteria bacterium]|nr:ABC transporter permease [Candidatus Rokubacteria bacterium]